MEGESENQRVKEKIRNNILKWWRKKRDKMKRENEY